MHTHTRTHTRYHIYTYSFYCRPAYILYLYIIYIFFFFSQNLFTIVLSILPAPYACLCRLLKTTGRRSFHPALIPTPEPGTGRLMHVRVRRDLDDLKNTSLYLCVCVCVCARAFVCILSSVRR